MSTSFESASGPQAAAQAPPALRVGELAVRVVADGVYDYPLQYVFPGAPEAELQVGLAGRLNGDGALPLPYDCLLVETPAQTVLVDSGVGRAGVEHGMLAGRLVENLTGAGVAPADVDVVVLTHAHMDHIGGLLQDGRLTFPGARHVMSRTEWDCWTSEEVLAQLPGILADPARAILPALERAGVLDLTDGDTEVVPGVHLLPAPGHTPGHCAVAVRSGHEQVVFLADAVLDELQFTHPQWTSAFDMDPDDTTATRVRLLEEAADASSPVLAYHVFGVGHIERDHGGYRFAR